MSVVADRVRADWNVLQSSTNFTQSVRFDWGYYHDDIGVPGDFDGDRRTDPAFWRHTSHMIWYILKSSTYYTQYREILFGLPSDIPILKRP